MPDVHTNPPSDTPARRTRRPLTVLAAIAMLTGAGVFAEFRPRNGHAAEGQTREFFIAADPVDWDYAPAGKNVLGGHFDENAGTFLDGGDDRIGRVNRKSLYREYTDDSFKTVKPRPTAWEHLGVLGPVIHAEVGDTITIHFKNNTPYPASIHPHGVLYDKSNEGADYDDGTSGEEKADDAVAEGQTHLYTWTVPERAGPGPHDGSSIMWAYHSHTDEVADTNSGLVGPLIVSAKGMAKPDGTPKDVDREFVALFTVFNENESHWLDWNIQNHAGKPDSVNKEDEGFVESNLKHSINGFLFGNMPGLDMHPNQKARWYVMGAGTEVDLHTPHWHGQTLLAGGMRMDNIGLLPMDMKVLDMEPDAPGQWLFHCHVNDHIAGGMAALFRVSP
jgi:FtsP/CotA-like multicopper oxidase with cupredoxin domain